MTSFIYELSGWPEFHWDDRRVIGPLADVRHCQGKLLGRMGGLGFNLRAEADLKALTAEVVKSSAIEGERLDTEEVRSSIARRLGMDVAGKKTPGRRVEEIVGMMLDATRGYSKPLTAERLFAWHASLFPTGYSGMHKIRVGQWRSEEIGAMQVVSGPIGRERVHFVAPAASRLEQEMERFLSWFADGGKIDPVLKAGVAHLWFVTIHPFEDGNGRIARAITEMALARAEGTGQRFYSMSTRIEAERAAYYHALERSQRGTLNIIHWLEWFLECSGGR